MNLRRTILIALLTAGVVGGYGSAIFGAAHRHSCDRGHSGGGCHSWHDRSGGDAAGDDDGDRK
jgi:hypothetical protein